MSSARNADKYVVSGTLLSTLQAELQFYRRQNNKLFATVLVLSGCWVVSTGMLLLAWIISRSS